AAAHAQRGRDDADRAGVPAQGARHASGERARAEARRVIPLQFVALVLVALGATCVVLVRDIVRQAMVSSVYALALVVLFVIFQAPDVALSELVVGAIGFPLVIVVAVVKGRG